jgi:hypothetical protein
VTPETLAEGRRLLEAAESRRVGNVQDDQAEYLLRLWLRNHATDFLDAAEERDRLLQERRWVPVGERLPEPDKGVLLLRFDGGIVGGWMLPSGGWGHGCLRMSPGIVKAWAEFPPPLPPTAEEPRG